MRKIFNEKVYMHIKEDINGTVIYRNVRET